MRFARCALALLACAGALSCGSRTVELSAAPQLERSTDPTTLGSINEQIQWISVVDDRVFWVGVYAPVNSGGGTNAALHSCLKDRCVETLVTYDNDQIPGGWQPTVQDGEIYWLQVIADRNFGETWQLVACPVEGCGPAGARVVRKVAYDATRATIVGPDGIYFYNEGQHAIFRAPFSGDALPDRIAPAKVVPAQMTVASGRVFWIEQAKGGATLLTALTDGSLATLTLARNLKVALSDAVSYGYSATERVLAIGSGYAYVTENTLTGSISRYKIDGSSDSPEVLSTPIRSPTNPVIDGETLYFQSQDAQPGSTLTSCKIANCVPSTPIAHGLDALTAFAVDDTSLYFATTDQTPDPNVPWDYPSAHLRRIPK